MHAAIKDRVSVALGAPVTSIRPLTGGCVGDVREVRTQSGHRGVVKLASHASGTLAIEGRMLAYLAEHTRLPAPRVFLTEPDLLVMEYIENDGSAGGDVQRDAGEHLAALHAIRSDPSRDGGTAFGFCEGTLIGGLPQANPWCGSWVEFYCEHRLRNMARQAHNAHQIDAGLLRRVEHFADSLDKFISEPGAPSLIHGDIWGGNVLTRAGRIAAFIDPAIYFAHAEIELAFITLFSTFGPDFFERYNELRPIAPGFFEQRKDIYNLFPLLVHARLFGSSYAAQVDRTLSRFGA